MGARYHIPQADYPHSTADGLAQIHGAPSQKSSAPTFGLVAFATGLPVKAAGEAINQTASGEINFTGKRKGAKAAYSPGPSARASSPGLHSGTTHAKNLNDVHNGVRSLTLPSQGGPTQSANNAIASNAGTQMKKRPFGMPPISMSSHSATAFSRKQAGVPSTPSYRGGRKSPPTPTQGKTPVVHAAVAGARKPVAPTPAKPITAAPPKTPTFATKTAKPGKPGVARPTPKTPQPTTAPKPVVTVTTPTMSTRTGKGHF